MNCSTCNQPLGSSKKFCGHCGALIDTSAKVTKESNKPKSKTVKVIVSAVASLALVATAIFVLVPALTPKPATFKATITTEDTDGFWVGEEAIILLNVTASKELDSPATVSLLDSKDKVLAETVISAKSKSAQLEYKVDAPESDIAVHASVTMKDAKPIILAKNTKFEVLKSSIPSSCDLPTTMRDLGPITAGQEGGEYGPVEGTLTCDNLSSEELGVSITFDNRSLWTKTPRADWDSWVVEATKPTFTPNPYQQTEIDGVPVLYDCYVPNMGDETDMDSTMYVHGIWISFWNKGCLDENTVYMKEAIAAVKGK